MKIWLENFSRASGAQKKGFPNFSPAVGFFSLWRHRKPLKLLITVNFLKFFSKTVKFLKKGIPKIFCAPLARKERGSQIFRLRRAFFVVEALKTAKKPLNFLKNVNFLKKGTSKFFRLRRAFFKTLVGRFYKFGRTKEGG